jgi:4-hydroxy-tetrahydrodipicolinate synthase
MAGPACIIPMQSVELYSHCRRGEWDPPWNFSVGSGASTRFSRNTMLRRVSKASLELQGYPLGQLLPPQAALPLEAAEEVRLALSELGALWDYRLELYLRHRLWARPSTTSALPPIAPSDQEHPV